MMRVVRVVNAHYFHLSATFLSAPALSDSRFFDQLLHYSPGSPGFTSPCGAAVELLDPDDY